MSAVVTTQASQKPFDKQRLKTLLLASDADPIATATRLLFALVMFPHGAQHALGWFGGFGFSGTYGWMTGTVGVPAPFAVLAILTELVAPIMLTLGIGTRLAAFGLGSVLGVAALTHIPNGFFMNWLGNQAGEGFEYHLLGVALALAIVRRGGGLFSIDRALTPLA